MAQRNPLNDRYQGDGPGGQTRKSAARAKPVTQAASSVHIKKKPQTDAEKRAARKASEKEAERKARERAARKAEREKAKAAAAAAAAAESEGEEAADKPRAADKLQPTEQPKGFLGKLFAPAPGMPATEEYRKWRRVYWVCIAIGVGFLLLSLLTQSYLAQNPMWMVVIGGAYVFIIAAFLVEFRKVRPLVRDHQRQSVGNKTPKQLKHEQEARERAAAVEAARKAAKQAKRPPRRKKSSDTIVPGDEQ